MKNLLKLGQGPRPDLLFEEEEKAKKSDTQPDGQKKKIEFEKGLRTVRKEAKKKAREEKKKQEHFRILYLRYSHENIPAGLKKIFI